MATLTKELEKISTPNRENEARVMNQINSLLSNFENDDREFLANRGLKYQKHKEREHGIYTLNEIKKVAVDYRLRFLPLEKFKGEFDVSAIQIMRSFEYENPAQSNYRNAFDYYILAPSSQFELEEWKRKDPLLFVRVNSGYKLLHSWGNDLSLWRKIFYFPLRTRSTARLTIFLLFILSAIGFNATSHVIGDTIYWNAATFVFAISAVFSFVLSLSATIDSDIFRNIRLNKSARIISDVIWDTNIKSI